MLPTYWLTGQHRYRSTTGLQDELAGRILNHDTFSRNTRNHLKQVFDALRELMTPPDPPKRPMGFIDPEDKGSKKTSGARLKT
jgi:hypothetical protein